ncbi:hypothetical protein GGI43DRAFT_418133 [Trichoderma evansii]
MFLTSLLQGSGSNFASINAVLWRALLLKPWVASVAQNPAACALLSRQMLGPAAAVCPDRCAYVRVEGVASSYGHSITSQPNDRLGGRGRSPCHT